MQYLPSLSQSNAEVPPQKIMYFWPRSISEAGVREKDLTFFICHSGHRYFRIVPDFARTTEQNILIEILFFKPFYAPVKLDGETGDSFQSSSPGE